MFSTPSHGKFPRSKGAWRTAGLIDFDRIKSDGTVYVRIESASSAYGSDMGHSSVMNMLMQRLN